MMNQMLVKIFFSTKFVTANAALERFLVRFLMTFKCSFRLECLVAGSTLEDFSCHVFLLHVSRQLKFVFEQEAAVITLQESRMHFHVSLEIFFPVELLEAKLALEVSFLLLFVTISVISKSDCR
jgi:hypothetical protein